jgi:carboxylesterase type B
MRHANVLVNLFAAASALTAREQETWTLGQEVGTQTGRIKGHAAAWPPGSGVSEYLGIPYAKVPVGSLRFAPPVLNKSNATFVADKYVRMPHNQ